MLTLYLKTGCPFCAKVLEFVAREGIDITEKNISEGDAIAEELIARGGKRQVPYLIDDERGVAMYESGDIIEYLSEFYATPSESSDEKPDTQI